MQGPRTRNERKQQLPNYLNEEQLLQELQHQAQQKQKQKQFEELQEKGDLLKHMQNYQMGGEQNGGELEDFLKKKIIDLKRENEQFKNIKLLGTENYQIYCQIQSPQPQDHLNYDRLASQQPIHEQQNFMFKGDQQKTQSELEREKRLLLRQEERQRRLLGIQASVYDQTQEAALKANQQQKLQQNNYDPPMPQVKQSIKATNVKSILSGSYEKQTVASTNSGGNQDILSNYLQIEQNKQQLVKQDYPQQQPQSNIIASNKDKQLQYKQELDQQIAQKRIRIQSAHPSYSEQPITEVAQSTKARMGALPMQSQDEALRKLQEFERKKKYADELRQQMQEKKNLNNSPYSNNQVSQHQNEQMQQQCQDPGFRENNPYYSNVPTPISFPASNPNSESNFDKEKLVQQEKKKQYRDALLLQMQEQKNYNKKRNITSARLNTQQSVPVQQTNDSEMLSSPEQYIQSPLPLPPKNQKLCKKITKQYEDEEQVRQKQIQQQEYQEFLRKQIEEQNRKKNIEKQKLKEEEERAEMHLDWQRQQLHGQQQQQQKEDVGNQSKISRRKRVDNQLINQNLETKEQIAIKEQNQQQPTQYQDNTEPIKQSYINQQPQQQLDLQTQNPQQTQQQQQPITPQYIQQAENYSAFVSQNSMPVPQQYPQQPMYPQQMMQQNQQIQSPYTNQFPQFQQPGQQFYQNQCMVQQQQQQQFQQPFQMAQPQQQFTQQQFWPNQTHDQFQQFNNQLMQQQVNVELQIQKDAMNTLQNQMQQLVEMYKNQITEIVSQKGTTDQQIVQLKQVMEEKFSGPYSEMNSLLGLNHQQVLQQQQGQQQYQKKYWQNNQQRPVQQSQEFVQQLQQVPLMETPFKSNLSALQQSLLPSSSDYVQPETHVMEQSFQKDLLLFEKLNKNKESFSKQLEELQQKEQFLNIQINEKEEFLRKSQLQTKPEQSSEQMQQKQNDTLPIPKDIDQKLSKVVNADYSYFDHKRNQKQTEKQFQQMKEALLSEQSEEEIDQSFEAANLSEIKKQEHEVKLGMAQFSNDQNSLVLQDEECPDQQNIQRFIESQVNEVNDVEEEENNESELKAWDKKILEQFEDVKKSGQPLINEELKAKLEKLSVHGSAEKDRQLQITNEIKKNYGKPKTYDIFGKIEKQNSNMLTKNKEKQEYILTRLGQFIDEALEGVGDDFQQEGIQNDDGSDNEGEDNQQIVDTQELYEQVQQIEQRNKLSFKDAQKSQESQRYQDNNEDN